LVDEELNDYMYTFIEETCNEIGPRAASSDAEIKAGDKIEQILKEYCDETEQEEFTSSPMAQLGGIKYGVLLLWGAVVFYWFSLLIDQRILQLDRTTNLIFLIIAIILVTIPFIFFVFEVILIVEVFDFLFPKKESRNIIGVINPNKEVKQDLIFGAHHDSAHVYNLFYLKTLGAVLIFVGFILIILIFIYVWLKFIFFFIPIDITVWFSNFGISMLIFTPFSAIYLFFIRKKHTLGAYDNLSGVSILLGIAKHMSENRNNDEIFPKHTRITLVSFACEEAGLRGSKRYVAKHLRELKDSNAKLINIDSISMKDKIVVVHRETLNGARHDKRISQELLNIGKDLGIGIRLGSLPFGGSDAVPFTRKKIPATSFMSFIMPKVPHYYHTLKDNPKVIEKDSLGQVLQICLEYIKKNDKMLKS
jgi:hypothetical protein